MEMKVSAEEYESRWLNIEKDGGNSKVFRFFQDSRSTVEPIFDSILSSLAQVRQIVFEINRRDQI